MTAALVNLNERRRENILRITSAATKEIVIKMEDLIALSVNRLERPLGSKVQIAPSINRAAPDFVIKRMKVLAAGKEMGCNKIIPAWAWETIRGASGREGQ